MNTGALIDRLERQADVISSLTADLEPDEILWKPNRALYKHGSP